MARQVYTKLTGSSPGYWFFLLALGLLVINGLFFARYMEYEGHWVTGMTNQVVWGIPHIFAIFLIVTASGVLNVASLSSVFDKNDYKGWARLSGLLAITMLVGGLLVLVLDLGRPDRLIVAMTHYNFKSIFAWNIFLYTGFILVVMVYLWMMFEQRMNQYTRIAGITALTWRIILTTGTGSIFGFLVARQAYDMAIMAPLFIAMSLGFGTAFFILVVVGLSLRSNLPGVTVLLSRLKNLLGIFVIAVLFLTIVYHLAKLYATELHEIELFILLHGGVYTVLFWVGQVLIGSMAPIVLLFWPSEFSTRRLVVASSMVIAGGFAQLYVIIIGGQAYPLQLFPGLESSSSFFDGKIANYTPSFAEFALGMGGVGFALLVTVLVMRVLPFLPGENPLPES
jgi:molybdopterin-containing oxidoreductase family membrane subunit